MIFRFTAPRFIEKNGFKIITWLGLVVFGIAGFIFYYYGVGAINDFQKAASGEEIINFSALGEIASELNNRLDESARLRKAPLNPTDIFR